MIHAGIYYAPRSLKAQLCIDGARRLYEYCDEHRIPYQRTGKVIVAAEPEEVPALDELERRGKVNGVSGLRRLNSGELREIEPHAQGTAALLSPHTGIVDFSAVAQAMAAELAGRGALVATACPVAAVRPAKGRIALRTPRGEVRARAAVFCAGLAADRLAVECGGDADPRIVPFRGGYLRLRPERRHLVRSLIYPVPDPRLPFLGSHLSRDPHGEVLVGPTALMVAARDAYRPTRVRARDLAATVAWPGTWRMARAFWRTGIEEIRQAAQPGAVVRAAARFVPELRPEDTVPGPAGVRAQAVARDGRLLDDFAFSSTDRALHVRNAPSPAATSSLAIAGLVADRAETLLDLPKRVV